MGQLEPNKCTGSWVTGYALPTTQVATAKRCQLLFHLEKPEKPLSEKDKKKQEERDQLLADQAQRGVARQEEPNDDDGAEDSNSDGDDDMSDEAEKDGLLKQIAMAPVALASGLVDGASEYLEWRTSYRTKKPERPAEKNSQAVGQQAQRYCAASSSLGRQSSPTHADQNQA